MKSSGNRCLFAVMAITVMICVGYAGSSAAADGGQVVKVLPLRVAGQGFDEAQLSNFTTSVVAKIGKYPKLKALPVPEQDPLDIMVDAGCNDFDAECMAGIGATAGADMVLYVDVNRKDGVFKIVLRYADVAAKSMKAPEGQTDAKQDLMAFLAKGLEGVFGAEPKPIPVDVLVNVVSKPAGGEVYLGQDFVGVAPVMVKLKPGEHTLKIVKGGFEDKVGTVNVDQVKENLIEWTLVPVVVPIPAPETVPVETAAEVKKPKFYKTWWFWTIVGVVVVGAGTAAGVLASQGNAANGRVGFSPDSYFAPQDVSLYH